MIRSVIILFLSSLSFVLCSSLLRSEPRESYSRDELDILDILLRLDGRSASNQEFETALNRRDYYRLAIVASDEMTVCKMILENLLKDRTAGRVIEFCSDEEESRQFEVTVREESVRVRQIRTIPASLEIEAELAFILVDGNSQVTVREAIENVKKIRAFNPNIVMGIMVLNDGSSPHLVDLTAEAFDDRCVAYMLNCQLDSKTVWQSVKELIDIYESDHRSGCEETRLSLSSREAAKSSSCLRRKADGSWSLDFAKPESSRVLAKAVFKTEYNLDVELPKGHLIPTIPNRVDYILWIEDLIRYALASGALKDTDAVTGVDIGTGPSCVYPLLATSMHEHWKFVATDVDAESCRIARKNVEANSFQDRVKIVFNEDGKRIISCPLDSFPEDRFTFVMTNPPFYDGQQDLDECRKIKNNPPPESIEFTDSEYFFQGGELAFIKIMIEESLRFRQRVLWYTSIVAKKSNLKPIKEAVKAHPEIKTYHWTRFIQGETSRWAVAWSFYEIEIDPKDKQRRRKRKGSLQNDSHMHIELASVSHDSARLSDLIYGELRSLGIEVEKKDPICLHCVVTKDTWCRKSRRGHPPPETRFDCNITFKDDRKINFSLPIEFKSEEQPFVSLVSHIQRKWSLVKKV